MSRKHHRWILNRFLFVFFITICTTTYGQKLLVDKSQILCKESGFLVFINKKIEFINEFGVPEQKQSDTLIKDFFVSKKNFDINKVHYKNYFTNIFLNSKKTEGNEILFEVENKSAIKDLITCAGDTIILNTEKGVNVYQKFIIIVPVTIYFQKVNVSPFFFQHPSITIVSDENKKVTININKSKKYYSIFKYIPERLCKEDYLLKQNPQ